MPRPVPVTGEALGCTVSAMLLSLGSSNRTTTAKEGLCTLLVRYGYAESVAAAESAAEELLPYSDCYSENAVREDGIYFGGAFTCAHYGVRGSENVCVVQVEAGSDVRRTESSQREFAIAMASSIAEWLRVNCKWTPSLTNVKTQ